MVTTRSDTTKSTKEPSKDAKKKGNGKTPAKPISLYPMDEEEALKRLLRVPPPGKDGKRHNTD